MKLIICVIILCAYCSATAQNVSSKQCKTCKKVLSSCPYRGVHPTPSKKCKTCGKALSNCSFRGQHPVRPKKPNGGQTEILEYDSRIEDILTAKNVCYNISVFFDTNSSALNSAKDLVNLESTAATAKATDANVIVIGSVSSKTGTNAYNQQFSEACAQAVADELVNLGVNRDKIIVMGIGGVHVVGSNLDHRVIIGLDKTIAPSLSVFFDTNSVTLNSKKDLVNLKSFAAAAKATGAKIQIVGYVDSQTGSDAYNLQLSQARAAAVADELVRLGINRDNIEVKGIAGVAVLAPYTLNNRAVITVK